MMACSRRNWWTGVAALTVLMTLGCGATEEPFAGTYVARVGETMVAVVADDPNGLAVAYACDGREGAAPTVLAWFSGTLEDGAAELSGPEGTLTVSIADGAASGELQLTSAAPRGFAGPRSADGVLLWGSTPPSDTDLLGGWIFADDGTQRGAVLKRSTGDLAAILLTDASASSATLSTGEVLTIKAMTTPRLVE